MKITEEIVLTVLKSMFADVQKLRESLYLVRNKAFSNNWQGIYSLKEKDVVCRGEHLARLSPSLFHFQGINAEDNYAFLFCLQKKRELNFGEYSGLYFQLIEENIVIGFFSKKVPEDGKAHVSSGVGLFDTSNEAFVIQPEYDSLVYLEKGKYYGTKDKCRGNKDKYFLIIVDENNKSTATEIEKIA